MNLKSYKFCTISFILSAALCICPAIYAADKTPRETGSHSISQYLPDGMKRSPARTKSRAAASIPQTFDPRGSKPWLTSVKDQDLTGCCWAFSSLDCAAISSMKKNEQNTDFSLSVWQLVYFNYNRISDPLGLTEGDINGTSSRDIVSCGGNSLLASMTMAQGISPARDSVAPFPKLLKAWNYGKGDVTLPANSAYQGYRLSESASLLSTDIRGIKENILSYGAGSLCYFSDAQDTSTYGNTYWNEKNNALYIGDTGHSTNHAVTVVGWDDAFPKENFGVQKPPKNGAWLIKNSWGKDWGDDGYFWLSYYDKSLTNDGEMVEFFRITSMNPNEHLYQYDGTSNFEYMDGSNIDKQANVFRAQRCESIKEISFFTMDPDVSYTIDVYVNKSLNENDPTGGTSPVFTTKSRTREQGYYTVKLNTPVNLEKDDYFTVVLQAKCQNGNISIPIDAAADYGWYFSKSSAKAGQSFCMSDGSWFDLNRQANAEALCNLRIKALTQDLDSQITLPSSQDIDFPVQEVSHDKISSIHLSLDSNKVAPDKSIPLDVSILPKSSSGQPLTYTSSNPAYASIDKNGVLQTTKAGAGKTVKITAHPTDGSNAKSTLTIKIQKKAIRKIAFKKKTLSLKANAKALVKALVIPAKGTNTSLRYTSSSPKYAKVNKKGLITAKKAGKGKKVKITAYSRDGSGKKASITLHIK